LIQVYKREQDTVQVHFTKSRLATLAKRPGGMWRGQAIAEAARLVEALREPAMDDIDALIGRLEIASTDRKSDPLAQMKEVQGLTDSLITLGGTFGLESLVEASKRLSDLAYAFRTRGEVDDKAIAVHVRAIRLFGPKAIGPQSMSMSSRMRRKIVGVGRQLDRGRRLAAEGRAAAGGEGDHGRARRHLAGGRAGIEAGAVHEHQAARLRSARRIRPRPSAASRRPWRPRPATSPGWW
jgi:hypothetical protein